MEQKKILDMAKKAYRQAYVFKRDAKTQRQANEAASELSYAQGQMFGAMGMLGYGAGEIVQEIRRIEGEQ